MAATQREYEFVLLHGACYGAWAWFPVEAELRKAGYKVTSMDMAGAGVHPADPDAIATFDEYHQPALEFLESLPAKKKVVLVGHSMAGFALAQLMERFPDKISLAVFVAAVLSASGVPLLADTGLYQIMTSDTAPSTTAIAFHFKNGVENPPTSFYYPASALKHIFFNDFDSEDIVVLASKLVRSYPNQMLATPITYTKERYGQVPSVYIRYSNDHTFTPEGQEYVSSRYGPFKEIIELEGAHFNFLKRPVEFAKLLVSLAQKHSVY